MRIKSLMTLLALPMLAAAFVASAQNASPAGRWKTYDEETGKPRLIVEVYIAHAMIRRSLVVFTLLCLLPISAWAQNTPIGRWRSIDDATGKPKAVIEVSEAGNGTLSAKIVQLIDTSDGPNPLCDDCKGARHNKPILGMTIAWGLKPQGKIWGGGRILDPENGKEYSVKMTPIAGGKKLEVRGFVGVALLGRTQIWMRESP